MPQDRLRKLTEENKQLATNLKREIDEMNPRAAAKSSKANKRKTGGSDLSSTRGSEERQSLPPGRGVKRGRDNEIEKVESSLSSNLPPVRRSPRNKRKFEEPESLETERHLTHVPNISIDGANDPPALSYTFENQQSSETRQHPTHSTIEGLDTSDSSSVFNQLEQSLLAIEAIAPTDDLEDIDLDFWFKEADSLDMLRMEAVTKASIPLESLEIEQNTRPNGKPPPKKRARIESYVPMNKLSATALQQRIQKMIRNKEKLIGNGAEAAWPNGPPKLPERHHKWSQTLRLDSHNHAKLGFYAEIKPTDHPVIAGFAPENPPLDLGRNRETTPPPAKRRKTKAAQQTGAISLKETLAEPRRTRSSSATEDKSSPHSVLDHSRTPSNAAEPGRHDADQIPQDRTHVFQMPPPMTGPYQDFELFERQHGNADSDDEEEGTNDDLEQEEHFYARPAVKIDIPDHLKAILVDDWENVTKNLSLVPIPAEHPVSEILDTYFEEEKGKRRLGSAEADLLEEVVQGTRDYFDQCLGKLLLYRFEREQYFRLYKAMEAGKEEFDGRPLKDKKIADIYGAEHLCRLFGKTSIHITSLSPL